MTEALSMIAVFVIQLITAFLAYQYLVHRVDGECQKKEFFQLKYDFLPFIAVLIGFIAATFVFVFGYLLNDDGFMRAFMNAEVMLVLSVVGYIDAHERIIPNVFIGLGLLFWLVLTLLDILIGGTPWLKLLVFSGVGGFACGGLLFIIALLVKSALGMGDVKLFFVLGLLYGLTDAYGILLFTVISMGLVSIALLIAKRITTKSTIPMAPFVSLGFILSILAGM